MIEGNFEGKVFSIGLPETRSAKPSIPALSLPKAGSTLFYNLLHVVAKRAGLAYFGLQEELTRLGLKPHDLPAGASGFLDADGYMLAGFRSVPPNLEIPAAYGGRTMLLIRDARDMLVSLYFSKAFSHRAPGSVVNAQATTEFAAEREQLQSTPLADHRAKIAPWPQPLPILARQKGH